MQCCRIKLLPGVGCPEKSAHFEHFMKTAEMIAQEHKVGQATVRRAAEFARAVDTIAENVGEDVRHKILGREINLTAKRWFRDSGGGTS